MTIRAPKPGHGRPTGPCDPPILLVERRADHRGDHEPGPVVWIDEAELASSVLVEHEGRRRDSHERILAASGHARVVELAPSRAALVTEPSEVAHGPGETAAAVEDICAARASRRAIEAVGVMRERAMSGQPTSESARAHLLASAGHVLAGLPDEPSGHASPAPVRLVALMAWMGRVETALQRVRAAMVLIPERWWNQLCPAWAVTSVFVTSAAVVLMLRDEVLAAAVVFSVRVVCSAILPPPYSIVNRYRRRLSWKACVLGHFTDALGLLGIAAYLGAHNRVVYSTLVTASAMFMLCATLFRVAALQGADYVRRLTTERLIRNGSLLVSVYAAALFQHHVPSEGVPLAAIACVGPLVYASVEVARVFRRDKINRQRRSGLDAEQRFLDRHLEIRRIVREQTPPPSVAEQDGNRVRSIRAPKKPHRVPTRLKQPERAS